MVKHGQFGLRLVRAETLAPYDEHRAKGGSNDIYAEVEPEDEFYLQLFSGAPEVVYADLTVDGTLIQKGHQVHPGVKSRVGVIRADSHQGDSRTAEVALRFARAQVHGDGKKKDACAYWTGQVVATFYGNPSYRITSGDSPKPDGLSESVATVKVPAVVVPKVVTAPAASSGVTYGARKTTYYLNPNLASSDVGYVPGKSADDQKKGVKSAEGSKQLRTHNFNWERPKPKKERRDDDWEDCSTLSGWGMPKVREPEKLGSVTLKYCSTVGLIHAGILDKPPNWDVERLKSTCSKRTREDHARILAEIKIQKFELKSEKINGQGEKVVETNEVEVLDLTECDN